MSVRPATPADRPGVEAVARACGLRLAEADEVLVAEDDGLRGFLAFRSVLDSVHLHDIGVTPEARRQGHGRALVGALVVAARARGAAQILLEVRAGNLPARQLYEATGFEAVGLRRRYYSDREDAALYTLELT